MTENTTTKVRALVLAALMVFSVFAGTVALTGTAAAANQEELEEDGYLYFQSYTDLTNEDILWGQKIAVDGYSPSESVVLKEDEGDTNRTVEQLSADEDGVVTLDTSDLESGDYFLDGTGFDGTTFEVLPMDLSVEFADDSVQNDETTEVEFDSNRGTYDVNVSANGDLDNGELADIFGAENVEGADGDNNEITLTGVSDGTVEADFDGIDTGEYEFDFESTDTSAESSDTINVTEAGDGDAQLVNSTVTEQQGDIAEFTVELSETSTGTVMIGSDADNYQANISVVDDDDDGEVTVQFNTYTAGQTSGDIVTAAGDDDEATLMNQGDDMQTLNDMLDTGDYDIRVSPTAISGADATDAANDETDIGTLVLQERSTDEMTLWRASSGTINNVEDADNPAEAVSSGIENGLVTQTDYIAGSGSNSDILIHQVSASGLEGLLANQSSSTTTQQFLDALGESDSLSLTIEQTEGTVGNNEDAKIVNASSLDSGSVTVIADAENNQYFVIVDPTELTFEDGGSLEDGDAYTSELNVQDARLLGVDKNETGAVADDSDEFQSVNATWGYEDATGSFENPTNVTASEDATITGETNIAPGSELGIQIRSADDTQPRFINSASGLVVQPDGTFNASFDLSDNAAGDEFTITARNTFADFDEADGNIVESASTETETETVTETETTETVTETETTETDAPDTETDAPDTETETEETSTDTPGFGVAVALVALLAAALLAGRRE